MCPPNHYMYSLDQYMDRYTVIVDEVSMASLATLLEVVACPWNHGMPRGVVGNLFHFRLRGRRAIRCSTDDAHCSNGMGCQYCLWQSCPLRNEPLGLW